MTANRADLEKLEELIEHAGTGLIYEDDLLDLWTILIDEELAHG